MITFIGSIGAPPWVKRYWVLNVFRHWSMDIMETSTVVGFKSGSVMYRKSVHPVAPSVLAASWILLGMDPNPTRKTIVK